MSLHAKDKGGRGEREVYKALNDTVNSVHEALGLEEVELTFQRNQNQSFAGGSDIQNNLGLSIEVKRQEILHLEKWWAQAETQAKDEGGLPILIYRKNRQPWTVIMRLFDLIGIKAMSKTNKHLNATRITISFNDFLIWFRGYYESSRVEKTSKDT